MVREIYGVMLDGLKCHPRVEGGEEGAIIDGFGGSNSVATATAAIEGIMTGLKHPS